jgi:hypothetical protein
MKETNKADIGTHSSDEDEGEPDTLSTQLQDLYLGSNIGTGKSKGKGKEAQNVPAPAKGKGVQNLPEPDEGAQVFWPHDLLSTACAKARVSVYGYESKSLRYGSITQSNIDNISSDFLQELRHESASGVPLIFIGHSLGGIIIKEVGKRRSPVNLITR